MRPAERPLRTVLVVEPAPAELTAHLAALEGAGYEATGVTTFEDAKRRLAEAPPDALVTCVRLDAFNGLHLVVRSAIDHPEMVAVVVDVAHDPVLESEAKRHGATYVVKPLDTQELLAAVAGAEPLGKRSAGRRWQRKEVTRGLSARIANGTATILNVSYGGFRVAVPAPPTSELSASFRVTLPEWNISFDAEAIWMNDDDASGEVVYGATLAEQGPEATKAWRKLVDSVK